MPLPKTAVFVCLIFLNLAWTARGAETDGVKIPVSANFPDKGLASMAVYDANGKMIRTLASAAPVEKGAAAFTWDGTTDLGLPAPAGDYEARGVWFTQGPKIEYRMKIGLSGTPPYLTADPTSAWGGNLGGPVDVQTNGKNLLGVFHCVESPRLTGIQLMDLDGKVIRFYTSFFPWDVRLAAAMDDTHFYLADAAFGDTKRLIIGKYAIDDPNDKKILCDIPAGDHREASGPWQGRWMADVRGLAVADGRVYVPVFLDNKVFVVDANSGAILHANDVPSPRGVAMRGGHGYVVSGHDILQMDADGKTGAAVVKGLDDPQGLALDAAENLYVSDAGAAQQVKVFSSDGKPVREIGVKGGSPTTGKYNPAGITDPKGLCVTPNGDVWVAQGPLDLFQEITVWDAKGERKKYYPNAEMLSGQGRLSPDGTKLYVGYHDLDEHPGARVYRLDWKTSTWQPWWSLPMPIEKMAQEDVFLGNGHIYDTLAKVFNNHMPCLGWSDGVLKGTNGKTYLIGGDLSLYLFDEQSAEPKLAAFLYTHRSAKLPDGRYQGDYDQGDQNWFAWSDLNGDGEMALDEVNFATSDKMALLKEADVRRMQDWQVNPDLSIYFLGSPGVADGKIAPWTLYLLKPTKVLPSGVPVYDWSTLEKVVALKVPDFKGGDATKEISFVGLNHLRVIGNDVYVSAEPSPAKPLKLTGVDGDGWWASRNWRMSPMKFDLKTGEPAWIKLGRRAPGVAKPGEMYYPGWGLSGSVDGVDYFADTLSQVWAWTDDGLYLGRLYTDSTAGISDANSLAIELTGAYVYKIDGHTYVLAGDHGLSAHEIKLPDLVRINAGAIKLTPERAAQAKPWDPDGPVPGKRPIHIAHSIFNFDYDKQKQLRTITIDGKLDPAEWAGIEPMEIKLDGKAAGSVQVTFDKQNLYLGYTVTDPNGLKNSGSELPYAPFVSGSYVDFNIAPKWDGTSRDELKDGDARVILARITGQTTTDYQMGFWPIKKALDVYPRDHGYFYKPTPYTVTSPAQSRAFDDIAALQGLAFAYQITPTGYTLEASVPFESLGINPSVTASVGFDASIGFSNSAGNSRVRAAHWAGETEAFVVDRPGSAELKPGTWGTLQLDRTPVP